MKSLTIELPDDVAELLEREQQRRGVDANELLAWLVLRGLANGTALEPVASAESPRSDVESGMPSSQRDLVPGANGYTDASLTSGEPGETPSGYLGRRSPLPEDYELPPPFMTEEEARARLDRKLGPGEYSRTIPWIGIVNSGHTDISVRMEEILREEFGSDSNPGFRSTMGLDQLE